MKLRVWMHMNEGLSTTVSNSIYGCSLRFAEFNNKGYSCNKSGLRTITITFNFYWELMSITHLLERVKRALFTEYVVNDLAPAFSQGCGNFHKPDYRTDSGKFIWGMTSLYRASKMKGKIQFIASKEKKNSHKCMSGNKWFLSLTER
jgi:hypothetical protein